MITPIPPHHHHHHHHPTNKFCGLGLYTQKPVLRQVDLKPSPKRGNAKTKKKNTTESELYSTTWTHKREPGLTLVCLEPSALVGEKQSNQSVFMTRVISRVVTPKDKTKTNPLAIQQITLITKSEWLIE